MKMQMKRRRWESAREKLSRRVSLNGQSSSLLFLYPLLPRFHSLSLLRDFPPIFIQSTKPASLVRPSHALFLNISCNAFAICRLLSFFISHFVWHTPQAKRGKGREEIKVKYCGNVFIVYCCQLCFIAAAAPVKSVKFMCRLHILMDKLR